MGFQLLDNKSYPLKVENTDPLLTFYPYEHRGTIGWNAREFMVFINHIGLGDGPTCYIEEIVGGHLEIIEDQVLAKALHEFALSYNLLEVRPPILRRLI